MLTSVLLLTPSSVGNGKDLPLFLIVLVTLPTASNTLVVRLPTSSEPQDLTPRVVVRLRLQQRIRHRESYLQVHGTCARMHMFSNIFLAGQVERLLLRQPPITTLRVALKLLRIPALKR